MNGEQNEASDYLKEEQSRTLLAMDVNRENAITQSAANLEQIAANVKLTLARASVRLRLSACAVALCYLAVGAAVYELVRFG